MLGRFKSIRYGPVLFAISALIALAMVALLGFECLARLPTAPFSGHFVAVLARKSPAAAASG